MKPNIGRLFIYLLFCISETTYAQIARNIELLDQAFTDTLVANSTKTRYSDCYGFTWKNEEYAVIGSTEGTHVYLISSNNQLIPKGFVRGRYSNMSVIHREYKTFRNYLYAVCDEGVSSLQIIDFQYLPDSIHLVKEDTTQFGRVHNIFIDSVNQLFYSCIHRSTVNTQTIAAPMKVFSLADPLNLVEMWAGPSDIAEVHDIYVRNNRAILNCGYDGLRVYDFTNPSTPTFLSSNAIYQDQGYNHQGWLTPDGTRYIWGDETNGKRLKLASFDGTNISIQHYFGTNFQNGSVPHNIMANDTFAFVAYYNEGFRVFDLRYPVPREIAYYKTFPESTAYKLNGNWGVYSNLPSKRLLASDRQHGLFLFRFDQALIAKGYNIEEVSVFPNPSVNGELFTVSFPPLSTGATITIYDTRGRLVKEIKAIEFETVQFDLDLSAGIYLMKTTYTSEFGNFITENKEIMTY